MYKIRINKHVNNISYDFQAIISKLLSRGYKIHIGACKSYEDRFRSHITENIFFNELIVIKIIARNINESNSNYKNRILGILDYYINMIINNKYILNTLDTPDTIHVTNANIYYIYVLVCNIKGYIA